MVRINSGNSLFMSLENVHYFLAWNIDDFDRSIVTRGHQLAIIIEEGQLPQQFMMRFQIGDFIFIPNAINDVQISIIIAGC